MIGRTLGHYQIVEKLGQGGMGEVYLARDTRLDREVAIKVMPAELASDPDRRARFEREAKAIAALNHPNVVTIHAVEEADDLLFLVMERVGGVTLSRKIPDTGLALQNFFHLALQLSDAVAAAHAGGITHRDLKPENVMVDDSDRVKVLDFGLAKLIDEIPRAEDETVALQTREGVILGTAAYMSPEQAEGKPVDPRSDVFSLGILIYEMLTGVRPFQGDTHMSTLTAVIRDEPRPVAEIRPELPRQFVRIVRRCLEKDPDRRYESARGVRYDLEVLREELVSGDFEPAPNIATVPESVRQDSFGSHLSSPSSSTLDPMLASSQSSMTSMPPASEKTLLPLASRNRLIGVVAVLVILVIAWTQWPRSDSGPVQQVAETAEVVETPIIIVFPFENLGPPDDEYFSAGITDEITTRLSGVKGLRVLSRGSAAQYNREGKTVKQIAEELGVDYVLEGAVRWQRSAGGPSRIRVTPQLVGTKEGVQVWAESYDRSMEEVFAMQAEIASSVVKELGVALSGSAVGDQIEERPTQSLDAYHSYLRANNTLTQLGVLETTEFESCIAMLNEAVVADPGFAEAYGLLARAHAGMVHFGWDQSAERIELARLAMERAMELKPNNAQVQLGRGFYFYHGLKEYGHAREALEKAYELQPGNAEIMVAIGYVLRRQNRVADALSWFERAQALSPNDSSMLYDLAETLALLRRYEESQLYAVESVRRSPRASRIVTMAAWSFVAGGDIDGANAVLTQYSGESTVELEWLKVGVAFVSRDYARALDILETCEDVRVNQFHFDSREQRRATIFAAQGLSDQSVSSARRALEQLEPMKSKYGDHSQLVAAIALAKSYLGVEEAVKAIPDARRSLELFPASKDSWIRSARQADLVKVLILAGRHDEAITQIRDLLAQATNQLSVGILRHSPIFDPLRDRPDFKVLVEG